MFEVAESVLVHLNDSVDVADELMSRHGLTAIRVYDEDGAMLGYLSERDVLSAHQDWLGRVFDGQGSDAAVPTVSDIFTGTTIDLEAGREAHLEIWAQ